MRFLYPPSSTLIRPWIPRIPNETASIAIQTSCNGHRLRSSGLESMESEESVIKLGTLMKTVNLRRPMETYFAIKIRPIGRF